MSKVKIAGKKQRIQADTTPLPKKILKDVVAIYVFFMFAIYPLYYEDKYYNMGDAKWHFFKWVTLFGLIVITTVFIWYQAYLANRGIISQYWNINGMSVLDWLVLGYALSALTSFLLSPYKAEVLTGYDGWYMGLISQLAFVVLYYFVSRFWRWDDLAIVIYLFVSAVVFLLCILNRFRIDPLEMYVGLDEAYLINFISTLGQATWFSSYMILLFPIGLLIFWHSDGIVKRLFSGLYVLLGSMTMIAQNSDSALLAYAAVYLILFCVSFRNNKAMRRFLECLVILFTGWKLFGLLEVAFQSRVLVLSGIMRALSIGPICWVLLVISVGLLTGYSMKCTDNGFDVGKYSFVRIVVLCFTAAAVLFCIIYIALNTMGVFSGTAFGSDDNYLVFNYEWGNNRGLSWIAAVGTFFKTDFVRKIFGAGPAGFYNEVYRFYSEPLNAKWGQGTVLTCAHNEWLNAIINVGLVGTFFYIGIFVYGIIRFIKRSAEQPETLAPAMCIAAYMVHNFFCYQQIICTPIVFIIIGAGEMLCRYGRREIWEPDGEI